MKYVIVIADGMADEPIKEINGETPVVHANTPNMDFIAKNGYTGLTKNVPDGKTPGSDVANTSIMGFDPSMLKGRGPLEAPSVGVELNDDDVAFRLNFINIKDGAINDFTADHITTEEADELIKTLNEKFGDIGKFYTGVSYRNLFVINDIEMEDLTSTPPHDVVGQQTSDNNLKPDNEKSRIINKLMEDSIEVLENHPVNKKRIEEGKLPANMIWLWGQGSKPVIGNFQEKYGLKGATITGVDLLKGISTYIGLDVIEVPGATAYFDTNYQNKVDYALESLKTHDVQFIHIEAPDEAGHEGNLPEKIRAIENIDSIILEKLLKELPNIDEEYTIAVLPDHPTPINVKTHTMTPVPFAIYSTSIKEPDATEVFSEDMSKGKYGTIVGHTLLSEMIKISKE
ncbi:cofactor-independent phosphoglycerate mutase [uncultured Methanosphaera sp.]|jgi:2,3-bisphosphoglycerate-independent phosphoglycerate mutase|uniref:cofactor-independent phosphoglycerate mutase n=1 Tax=uncultured Methanosphaera sp. TaxID=262501 RepID=UPI000DC48BC6|nr:cofactor-independent phosphoglycerate mutase [uncultured Methanosphaera sp.]RAP45317.1 MAG: cofactor-independent phosphoglycerate mutase [Methanosphaera sp. SHI1033]